MDSNNHASEGNDFRTVEEVQNRCRVTRKTVEAWIESGELPHYRLGPRTIRIDNADLEEFLSARRHHGIPPELRSAPPAAATEGIRSRCSSPEEEVGTSRTAAA